MSPQLQLIAKGGSSKLLGRRNSRLDLRNGLGALVSILREQVALVGPVDLHPERSNLQSSGLGHLISMPTPASTRPTKHIASLRADLGCLAALELENRHEDGLATGVLDALVLDDGARSGFLHGLLGRAELLALSTRARWVRSHRKGGGWAGDGHGVREAAGADNVEFCRSHGGPCSSLARKSKAPAMPAPGKLRLQMQEANSPPRLSWHNIARCSCAGCHATSASFPPHSYGPRHLATHTHTALTMPLVSLSEAMIDDFAVRACTWNVFVELKKNEQGERDLGISLAFKMAPAASRAFVDAARRRIRMPGRAALPVPVPLLPAPCASCPSAVLPPAVCPAADGGEHSRQAGGAQKASPPTRASRTCRPTHSSSCGPEAHTPRYRRGRGTRLTG